MLRRAASSASLGSAAASSTGGAVQQQGGHHPYSLKFPAVKTAGDDDSGEEASGLRECAMTVIDIMIENPASALPLSQAALKKRQKSMNLVPSVSKEHQFSAITTVGKLESAWVVQVISELSDLSIDEVLKSTKHDDQAARQMLTFATSWLASTKIPNDGVVKDVMKAAIVTRHGSLGSRLKDFKKNGGLRPDGALNWKAGCYTLVFSSDKKDAKLKEIKHCSGAKVTVEDSAVDRTWAIQANWSDYEAALVRKPLKPSPLCKFFEQSKTGPYMFKKVGGDCKEFVDGVIAAADAYHKGVQPKSAAKSEEASVSEQLKEMQSARRKVTMEEARKKAQQSVSEVKRRRTLQMQKTE